MKAVLYSLLLFLFSKATFAQTYDPVKLFDMGSGAELITYGVISKLEDKYYYLDCILAKGKISTLKIQRYIGRPGSFRFARYETGQKLFVFLKRVNGEYQLYSPGIESEIPIIRDSLVIDMNCFLPKTAESLAPGGITPEYKAMRTFAVGNKMVFGLRFSPRYLYESIKAFNDCYQVILKRPNTFPSFSCFNFFNRLMRERTELSKQKSRLMKLMFMDMEEAQVKNCR